MSTRRLPVELTTAKAWAERFRVVPAGAGRFNVWRFRDWPNEPSGWAVIIAGVSTSAEAWVRILDLLGLVGEDEPKLITATYVRPISSLTDDDRYFGFGA